MGYNSSRFDIPVLLPYFRRYANEKNVKLEQTEICSEKSKENIIVVKRESSYIQLKLGSNLMFRDM